MNVEPSAQVRLPSGSAASMLAECDRLLALHLHDAVRRFGASALGVIDLPGLSDDAVVPAQVRVAAVLLWAREVESAGLPGFVEALARRVSDGTLLLPITAAGDRLAAYHRARVRRLTAGERAALYARCFGADAAGDFDEALDALTGRLDAYGRALEVEGTAHALEGIAAAARRLGEMLSRRAVGVAGYAAREITEHVREAVALLRDPELSAALGHSGVWSILRWHGEHVLGRALDPTAGVTRAQAGQALLGWVAEHGAGVSSLSRKDPVIAAAASWRMYRSGSS